MSYANSGSGRERIAAIGLVGLIQGGIITALVSGLAVQFVTKTSDPILQTYNVPFVPPPPPVETPPPETAAKPLETVSAPTPLPHVPTPIIPVPSQPFIATNIDLTPPPPVDTLPTPTRAEPSLPPAPNLSRNASVRGNIGDWFPQSAYPTAALRAEAEGRVSVTLTISPAGRATGCEVVSGSGNAALDTATCKLALSNARFQPALDANGNKIAAQIKLPPVLWRIER